MAEDSLKESFYKHSRNGEIVIIEGNRGLYDGVNVEGAYSTAELAANLALPVLLVVDCTKTTRTVAALVLGCKMFDDRVDIRGIILNRVGTARHEKIVREAIERFTGIPVVGAIHRSKHDVFPQRHLGVIPFQEHDSSDTAIQTLTKIAHDSLDLKTIEKIMAPVKEISSAESDDSPLPVVAEQKDC